MFQKLLILITITVWLQFEHVHGVREGRGLSDGRIIGGFDAAIYEAPYQVSILYERRHVCGGAIMSHNFVVTAAHCVKDTMYTRLLVIAGHAAAARGLGTRYLVNSYKVHADYDSVTSDNDIGLIKIAGTFKFGNTMQPIDIPENMILIPGVLATVTGWGYTYEGGYMVRILRKARIPLVDHTRCEKFYEGIGDVTDNMICAGQSGRDACQGDSGGPLVYQGQLIGLVSWGYGCARTNFPGVYTNVAKYAQWLREKSLEM